MAMYSAAVLQCCFDKPSKWEVIVSATADAQAHLTLTRVKCGKPQGRGDVSLSLASIACGKVKYARFMLID